MTACRISAVLLALASLLVACVLLYTTENGWPSRGLMVSAAPSPNEEPVKGHDDIDEDDPDDDEEEEEDFDDYDSKEFYNSDEEFDESEAEEDWEEIEDDDLLEEPGPFIMPAKMTLNNKQVPRLGFGTAGLGDKTFEAVAHALTRGFRLIDTAAATQWYDEVAVGKAIASVSKQIPREDIILVTKIWPTDFGYKKTLKAAEKSLERLATKYVDLLLLHFPECVNCDPDPDRGTWLDSWKALEKLYRDGKAKAIGVSNFDLPLLETLLEKAQIPPHDVQNWMDPFHQDHDVRALCAEKGIHYTAYSTLGTQWQMRSSDHLNPVLENPLIQELSDYHEVSPALIVLSWALQEDVCVIPRSSNLLHIDELAALFHGADWLQAFLSQRELNEIDDLDGLGEELMEDEEEGDWESDEDSDEDGPRDEL